MLGVSEVGRGGEGQAARGMAGGGGTAPLHGAPPGPDWGVELGFCGPSPPQKLGKRGLALSVLFLIFAWESAVIPK